MSSLHHDRLLEEGAAPAETATTALAPVRSTSGDVEGKATSTVPPQRQGKAQQAKARPVTDPTTRPAAARAAGTPAARTKAARTATAKAAGAKAGAMTAATAKAATARVATARAATRKAATAGRTAAAATKAARSATGTRGTGTTGPTKQRTATTKAVTATAATSPVAGEQPATPDSRPQSRSAGKHRAGTAGAATPTAARAAVVRAIAAKVAADAAVARRRPTPYKRSAVDLGTLAPVTDVAALVDPPQAGPEAAVVVVVKDAPAAPSPAAASVEPVRDDADPAGVVAAVAGGRRGLLTRRPPSGRRRAALYLAAALVGGLGVSGASVVEPATVATQPVSHSVSVAAQLGIEGSAATEVVDEEDTSRLREMVVSRTTRDAERTAAADAQAEADRLAAEEAERAAAEAARPKAVLPVAGARLTSGFGARWGTLHAGIDLAAPMRTPEYAAMDGVVLEAGAASGYGLAVYIQHENGDVTVYGHMDEILVEPGQVVRAGDTIALLGNRGQSTGPHLHFEVHVGGIDGQRIDPVPWLRERGVAI
ncbi:M23 family metallopeptidase [Blastococcus sp. SYSU DS0539]